MDPHIVGLLFRELSFMAVSVVCAFVLVGGFTFMEDKLKKALFDAARN